MHFTYALNPDRQNLMQGDVLGRTPEVDEILKEFHPYFYHNKNNKFFIVLTQSCDLAKRDITFCKSPYINIAPVREIRDVLVRQIQLLNPPEIPMEDGVYPVTNKQQAKLSEFLQRLYNNNEPGCFF